MKKTWHHVKHLVLWIYYYVGVAGCHFTSLSTTNNPLCASPVLSCINKSIIFFPKHTNICRFIPWNAFRNECTMASTVIQFKIAFLHPSLDIDLDVGEREKKRIMYIATGVYVRFKLVYARDKNNKKNEIFTSTKFSHLKCLVYYVPLYCCWCCYEILFPFLSFCFGSII